MPDWSIAIDSFQPISIRRQRAHCTVPESHIADRVLARLQHQRHRGLGAHVAGHAAGEVADEHHRHHAVQVVDRLVVDLQKKKTREMVQRQMKMQRG